MQRGGSNDLSRNPSDFHRCIQDRWTLFIYSYTGSLARDTCTRLPWKICIRALCVLRIKRVEILLEQRWDTIVTIVLYNLKPIWRVIVWMTYLKFYIDIPRPYESCLRTNFILYFRFTFIWGITLVKFLTNLRMYTYVVIYIMHLKLCILFRLLYPVSYVHTNKLYFIFSIYFYTIICFSLVLRFRKHAMIVWEIVGFLLQIYT